MLLRWRMPSSRSCVRSQGSRIVCLELLPAPRETCHFHWNFTARQAAASAASASGKRLRRRICAHGRHDATIRSHSPATTITHRAHFCNRWDPPRYHCQPALVHCWSRSAQISFLGYLHQADRWAIIYCLHQYVTSSPESLKLRNVPLPQQPIHVGRHSMTASLLISENKTPLSQVFLRWD